MEFKIISDFYPTGDQPEAIRQLSEGLRRGEPAQTLLGVTGSGKTFTIANVVQEVKRPTLVLSHNKTLAAQLYAEFKQFFPDNAVEYFVSYYDYYQPEAYIPVTDTYIEKDLAINDEIEKLRLAATSALLSGRNDVIVISSVSCIYGMGNPAEFSKGKVTIKKGQVIARNQFLHKLVDGLYSRTEADFNRGNFRVKGDTIDIWLAYADHALRVVFWGDEIESIETIDPMNYRTIEKFEVFNIFPANIFVTSRDVIKTATWEIQQDMVKQMEYLKEIGKHIEAKRLEDRVTFDLEMIRELGYCSGIENYSRYFDRRNPGSRPFCLLDYFPKDFLMVIDESHVTVPQIRAMYGGDRSRKVNLVEYGFRLPAALDNRPLKFEEFETLVQQIIYVSATPAEYELEKSGGVVVEQLIRPTGLLDPVINVRPSGNQVDDLLEEIAVVTERDERVLVTTLTKRMAEELAKYLERMGIRCRYIHSDVDTLERVEILHDLRKGMFDVLIGVNLLREGLDLPEVSLVAILDADKEGFLRSERSLVQTVGRAARNVNGRVIMYADKITDSMRKTIEETNRRREKQILYNTEHGITPTQIVKSLESPLAFGRTRPEDKVMPYSGEEIIHSAADPVMQYLTKDELLLHIEKVKKTMEGEAKQENFIEAARLRDELFGLMELLKTK
ncbi:MAG TPA: excinuclease ABC subunit UvrB [Flavobacteriales bacterium]|mgnify:CR=1 FL=1|nr:excinuclease ABC subunit UvrB [Flavobacteriales bacterium]HRJ34891.1 excinuclease ABC subunit UvrB [Flavobacteriales bacterium]HRJ39469.1 excinuclease ABC subunit UvrB [Flavobacteriales bacterium]